MADSFLLPRNTPFVFSYILLVSLLRPRRSILKKRKSSFMERKMRSIV